jgi:FkbM family methyltransferase
MNVGKRARNVFVERLAGRRRLEPAFRFMRDVALVGMYIDAVVDRYGESAALAGVRDANPHVNVVFDVGAFRGEWAAFAARAFPEATIYAFEPSSDNFSRLETRTNGKRVVLTKGAVSNTVGTQTLYSSPNRPMLNSIFQRDLSPLGIEMSDEEQVDVTTIDLFCAEHEVDHIDFLKIDAEGADLAVLEGATRMLADGKIGAVQFEMGPVCVDSHTFLRDFLDALGPSFRCFLEMRDGLLPVTYSEKEEVFAVRNYLALRSPG